MKGILMVALAVLCAQACRADQFVTTWIVYKASVTQAEIDTAKNYGRKNYSQPGLNTDVSEFANSTECWRFSASTQTNLENNVVLNWEALGKSKRYSSQWIHSVYDNSLRAIATVASPVLYFCDPPSASFTVNGSTF